MPGGADVTRRQPVLVTVFAVACGVTIANNYYAQPLLDLIGREFGLGASGAGLVYTLGQFGYIAGLLVVVPLGDVRDRRRLITVCLLVACAALMVAAGAPDQVVLWAAMIVVGISTVAVQVLVAWASMLVTPERRGRAVGTVMSGLILGQLLARTFAGAVADVAGWRAVYLAGAAMTLLVLVALRRLLPPDPARASALSHGQLLRSVATLLSGSRELRIGAIYGALTFAAFGAMWTTLAFLLARPPYGLSPGVIGLFGLTGVFGIAAAQSAGRLADRGHAFAATAGFLACVAAGFVVMSAGGDGMLAVLVAGIVLVDFGVFGTHITQQSVIYDAAPELRSRITTAYMSTRFLGGAVGSAAGAIAWSEAGWPAVCALGYAFAAAALLLRLLQGTFILGGRRSRPAARSGRRRSPARAPRRPTP